MIAIHTKTKKEFKKVLEIFEKKGWRWWNRKKPLYDLSFWGDFRENTCLEYKNYFWYGHKRYFYTEPEIAALSFKEFLELEKLLKKHKFLEKFLK